MSARNFGPITGFVLLASACAARQPAATAAAPPGTCADVPYRLERGPTYFDEVYSAAPGLVEFNSPVEVPAGSLFVSVVSVAYGPPETDAPGVKVVASRKDGDRYVVTASLPPGKPAPYGLAGPVEHLPPSPTVDRNGADGYPVAVAKVGYMMEYETTLPNGRLRSVLVPCTRESLARQVWFLDGKTHLMESHLKFFEPWGAPTRADHELKLPQPAGR